MGLHVLEHGEVIQAVGPDGVAVVIPRYDYFRNGGTDYRELDRNAEAFRELIFHPAARWLPTLDDLKLAPAEQIRVVALSGDFCSCGGLQVWTGRCKTCQACGTSGGCG